MTSSLRDLLDAVNFKLNSRLRLVRPLVQPDRLGSAPAARLVFTQLQHDKYVLGAAWTVQNYPGIWHAECWTYLNSAAAEDKLRLFRVSKQHVSQLSKMRPAVEWTSARCIIAENSMEDILADPLYRMLEEGCMLPNDNRVLIEPDSADQLLLEWAAAGSPD